MPAGEAYVGEYLSQKSPCEETFGIFKRQLVDNIQMYFKETERVSEVESAG